MKSYKTFLKKRVAAYTLTEILVVLVIIGILVLLALPNLLPLITKAKSTVLCMTDRISAHKFAKLVRTVDSVVIDTIPRTMRADDEALNLSVGRDANDLAVLTELYGNSDQILASGVRDAPRSFFEIVSCWRARSERNLRYAFAISARSRWWLQRSAPLTAGFRHVRPRRATVAVQRGAKNRPTGAFRFRRISARGPGSPALTPATASMTSSFVTRTEANIFSRRNRSASEAASLGSRTRAAAASVDRSAGLNAFLDDNRFAF